MPIETIRGEPFNLQIDGPDGAPVLLLSNSLGTNLGMWDPQIALWSRHLRVVRYDSRGHGRSVADDGPYTIAQLGGDAVAILDHLGIEKAHWCGLSKGGMVGQWVATNAGHRLDRVVLANTAAVMGPPESWDARIERVRAEGMGWLVGPTLERWFSPAFRARETQVVARVSRMIETTPPVGYASCCAAIRDMDQRESVRAVTNPVLVVIGSVDPATPPAAGRELAAAIAGAQTLELDAAHLSNLEQPDAFGAGVLDFLTR